MTLVEQRLGQASVDMLRSLLNGGFTREELNRWIDTGSPPRPAIRRDSRSAVTCADFNSDSSEVA